MNETLKQIIEKYKSGLLSTPNIQIINQTLSDELIQFPTPLIGVGDVRAMISFLARSCFRDSKLINMKFIKVTFESSFFEKCLIQNCIFKDTYFDVAEFEQCVFKNCQFIHCRLTELEVEETIFDECIFSKCSLDNAILESCHFIKPVFDDMSGGQLGSAVLINSKFSNSKKLLEFKGEIYFQHIIDQVEQLSIDEE